MIDKLTDEQKAKIDGYITKWKKEVLSTERANRPKAETAIPRLYALGGFKPPKDGCHWFESPLEASRAAMDYVRNRIAAMPENKRPKNAEDLISRAGQSWVGGNTWGAYAAWADFYSREVDTSLDRAYVELAESCGYYFCLEDACFLTERPIEIHINAQARLHSTERMAIKYASGLGLYALNGIYIPEQLSHVIKDRSSLTVEVINQQTNMEIKRELILLYGQTRYLRDSNPEVLDTDLDASGFPRRLLRLNVQGIEPIISCQVVNSTSEPEGTISESEIENGNYFRDSRTGKVHRYYFLNLDPELRPIKANPITGIAELIPDAKPQKLTAHNAVASSFAMYGHEYGKAGQVRQGDVLIVMLSGEDTKTPFRES